MKLKDKNSMKMSLFTILMKELLLIHMSENFNEENQL